MVAVMTDMTGATVAVTVIVMVVGVVGLQFQKSQSNTKIPTDRWQISWQLKFRRLCREEVVAIWLTIR